jgi:hypothetical protein
VDRRETLSQGKIINLTKFGDIKPPELQVHVDDMFPAGVSNHGDQYFLNNNQKATIASPSIEIIYEYVRRASFSNKPSRFQSFFACGSELGAINFRQRYGKETDSIWLVEAEEYFMGDMNLLQIENSILVISYFANKYWRGEPGDNPFWEILLNPPISVVSKAA